MKLEKKSGCVEKGKKEMRDTDRSRRSGEKQRRYQEKPASEERAPLALKVTDSRSRIPHPPLLDR